MKFRLIQFIEFIGLFALLIMGVLLFGRMGKWLVKSQKPETADFIFVLLGPVPDRALQAFDLYKAGFASKIVFANEFQFGAEQLTPYGIQLENTSSIFKRTLIQLGVKAEDIEILPQTTSSTQEEAIAFREFISKNTDYQRVLLVTSSYHSRRTFFIFEKAIKQSNPDFTVVSVPSRYTAFDAEKWWKKRDNAKMVVLEYLKLLNFLLIERFRL
ncbi:MAG: YdcF family protein [Lentimicrobium sp.]|jgi:uncharacterized SAM-binding protein YcdF (DUF218 family)|nr:YdcF family protein [Lentimicrobium sp.]